MPPGRFLPGTQALLGLGKGTPLWCKEKSAEGSYCPVDGLTAQGVCAEVERFRWRAVKEKKWIDKARFTRNDPGGKERAAAGLQGRDQVVVGKGNDHIPGRGLEGGMAVVPAGAIGRGGRRWRLATVRILMPW